MPKGELSEETMRRRGKWLCRAGWGMFGLSLLSPAVLGWNEWLSGWECFRVVLDIARALVTGEQSGLGGGWQPYYYAGFALTNLCLLASPLLLRFCRRKPQWLRRVGLLSVAASVYSASYFALGGLASLTQLHIGYYLWTLSFAAVGAGALHLAMQQSAAGSATTGNASRRTADEIAALAELEAYLAGAVVTEGRDVSLPVEVKPEVETLEPAAEVEIRTINRSSMRHLAAHSPGAPA